MLNIPQHKKSQPLEEKTVIKKDSSTYLQADVGVSAKSDKESSDLLDTKKNSPNRKTKTTTLKRPKIVESSISEDDSYLHQASVIPKFVHTLK